MIVKGILLYRPHL